MKLGMKSRIYNAEIRNRREDLGLTQDELGVKMGYASGQLVGAAESLKYLKPTQRIIVRLAQFFGVAPEDLCPPWLELIHAIPKENDRQIDLSSGGLAYMVAQWLEAPDNVSESVDMSIMRDDIKKSMKRLSPREDRAVTLRYGLNDGPALTFGEVGKDLDVTRERARQIIAKAERKMQWLARFREIFP